MRALLDLMRENETARQNKSEPAAQNLVSDIARLLEHASQNLKILDPEVGDQELIQAVAVELDKVCRQLDGRT